MKYINYQIGGGYVYQWWIVAFLKFTIDNFDKLDSFPQTKKYSNEIKETLLDVFGFVDFSEVDVFLEGDGQNFEDINLLFKNYTQEKTDAIFIQVKGGSEINYNTGKYKKDKTLDEKKVLDVFSKFLRKNNIYQVSNNSILIFLGNKKFTNHLYPIIKGEDIELLINFIVHEVKKRFKTNNSGRSITKIRYLVTDIYSGKNIYKNRRLVGPTLPFKNFAEQNDAISLIRNMLALINRTKVIDNIKLINIINKLRDELGEVEMKNLFYNAIEKSIDISTIEKSEKAFEKYLQYDDLYFIDKNKASDLESINLGKFL